jgi:hypothetical protein
MSGSPSTSDDGASGELDPGAGNPSTGPEAMPALAPFDDHDLWTCDCTECSEWWADEYADVREGE